MTISNLPRQTWCLRTRPARFMLEQAATVRAAATRFADGQVNTVFAVNEAGACVGSFSRGDLIRAVAADVPADATIRWNASFERLHIGDDYAQHLAKFDKQLGNVIPVLDHHGRCRRVFERTRESGLEIAGKRYVPGGKPLVIAEIGNNHNGSPDTARQLVDAAAAAGADAVKFQARSLPELYVSLDEAYLRETDYATAYTIRQLARFNLSHEQLSGLMDYARQLGLAAICTPFDESSLEWLLDYEPDGLKIASADFSNLSLHRKLIDADMPVLMSTGMNTVSDIEYVAGLLRRAYVDCTFLHTNSTYPTAFSDVQLDFVDTLRRLSPSGLVGYSGHERGTHIPLIAASRGCVVIEKHLTLDRSQEGMDHSASLLPQELAQLCDQLSDAAEALQGDSGLTRRVSQGEVLNAVALEKGIYLACDKRAGEMVQPGDVIVRSPRVGLSPLEWERDLSGRPLTRDRARHAPLMAADFTGLAAGRGMRPEFLGRFGLPVRQRDAVAVQDRFAPAFVEYHLFATDLEEPAAQVAQVLRGRDVAFHAPEQFAHEFVLDLVSDDPEVRARSEHLLLETVTWCLRVAEAARSDQRPYLIVNVGGAVGRSQASGHVPPLNRVEAFDRVVAARNRLWDAGVHMLPQTMPPFPWHFGGQGRHRLFVSPDDLMAIQSHGRVEFCLDLSHSYLACDYLHRDFYDDLDQIADVVGYCHVADARPPNGEGLQIGDGQIDMRRVNTALGLSGGQRPWIAEVWNGHMNDMEGFGIALDRLTEAFSAQA